VTASSRKSVLRRNVLAASKMSPLPPSELWFIDGDAYDLNGFVERHPGGREALRLAQGTNCTELFRAYHLLRGPSLALLKTHRVDVDHTDPKMAELLGGTAFTFADDGFYKTLATRVRQHFKDSGQTATGSTSAQVFAVGIILLTIALSIPAYVFGSLWGAVALGLVRALTSVGPGHSMSHFSQFPRGNWNSTIFRLASPFLVSTWSIWTNSHIRSHHVSTLTTEDLQDNYPLKRVQTAMEHKSWHRLQHFYIWPIYLFALPLWAMQDFLGSLVSLVTTKFMSRQYSFATRLENVLGIGFNLLFVVAMPFFFLDWQTALSVLLVSSAITSPLVVIQIVVNHEVPDTMNQVVAEAPIDWGAHQVLTSHNFAVNSPLALHLSGGLNMQVEHHLFPGVHYVHYPALSAIVQKTCVEFGLPYHTSAHIWEAMFKHYQVLKLNSVP
jgi:linoleoyl-CoA desaturase